MSNDSDPPALDFRGQLAPEVVRTAQLLAGGLTDSAIARREGVNERTVRRRVGILMQAIDARTRFHAGYRYRIIEEGAANPPRDRH